MNWRFLPNLITLIRIFLLIPLTYFLLVKNYKVGVILFFIAGFSDALDGFLAKRFSWVSRFGAIMDPLADKALLIVTMFVLTLNGHLSWWLLGLVIFRDVYIVLGAYLYHKKIGPYEMQPSQLSKLNTFIQLLLVMLILVSMSYYEIPDLWINSLVILTYLTTITSGFHYTWVWGKRFKNAINTIEQSNK
jgi:cardiolipin synthase